MSLRIPAVLAAAAVLTAGLLALPAQGADAASGAIAWSVGTVDGENGTGRPNFQLDAKPGSVVDDELVVVNTGSSALKLHLYPADAYTTPAGLLDLDLADTSPRDLGSWVALDRTDLRLAPGARTTVPFRVTVPKDARPGDHSGGIVTSLVTTAQGSPLTVDRRLGIRVQLRVAGALTPASSVENIRVSFASPWNPLAGGTLTVAYDLRNTGNTRLAASDSLTAAGPLGVGAVAQGPRAVPEVLPGSTVHVERTLPAVAALGWLTGTLHVTPAVVGSGRGSATVAPISVDVSAAAVPWALVALLTTIALVILAIVLVRRRRGRRTAS